MQKLSHVLISFLVFIGFSTYSFAQSFQSYEGYVNDFENILVNDDEIENILSQFEKDTSVEIAIVTVSGFEGTTIEDYAVKLFEKWKIGKAEKDNGLLFLISSNQRQSRIEVGYGLEGTLPDSLTGRIQDIYMIPKFKNNDYSGGVLDGVNAAIGVIKEDPTVVEKIEKSSSNTFEINEGIFAVLFFVFYILSLSRSWWMGGVVGALFGLYLSFRTPTFIDIFYFPLIFGVLGLVIDYLISRTFVGTILRHSGSFVRSSSSSSGGGLSFGGGSSGGGGSSRSW